MTRLVVFAGVSVLLAHLSRASLTTPRSHGFHRFLAWEAILGLAVLNFRGFGPWFADPLAPRQLASWVLLFGSIVPAVWGAQELRKHGGPRSGRKDPRLFAFEKTSRLVTTGPFEYVRHPLYSSLLLLAWGVFLKRPTAWAGALALGATAFLAATAKAEEAENLGYFGDAYREYLRKTKMFLPFVL